MKFIFPKNYNFKNKFLGFIDYPTAIFNVIMLFLLWSFSKTLFKSLMIRCLFIILLYFPFLLFCIIGFNGENVLYILYYILKFLIRPKLYLYK